MFKKAMTLLTVLTAASVIVAGCGQQQGGSAGKADGEASEAVEEAAAEVTEEPAEAAEEAAEAEQEDGAESTVVHPYAWLGLQDIPRCNYLDIISSNRYARTYDSYAMGYKTEETEYVDGTNFVKINGNQKTYTIKGKIISLDENTKMYMETDMGAMADSADERIASAMASGTNLYGRRFTGTGKGTIPLYSEDGDSAEYEYYEFDYPESEQASGTKMIERYYMKDGDIMAVYEKTEFAENEFESLEVIKNISADIPDGALELPDLSEYSKYE